jgi:hypothetical protein
VLPTYRPLTAHHDSRLCKELPFSPAYQTASKPHLGFQKPHGERHNQVRIYFVMFFLHLVHDVIAHDSSVSGPNLHVLKKANRFMGL